MSPLQCFYKLNSFLHKCIYISRLDLYWRRFRKQRNLPWTVCRGQQV